MGTGVGKGQCDADTMEFRKSDAIVILLSWLWCLGQVTYFLSHKCKIVDGPSQDFSVDNSGEWTSSTCGGLTGAKCIGGIVHASFPLSWKLYNVPVEWCNLVKLNLSNSKWHVSCHPDWTHSLIWALWQNTRRPPATPREGSLVVRNYCCFSVCAR